MSGIYIHSEYSHMHIIIRYMRIIVVDAIIAARRNKSLTSYSILIIINTITIYNNISDEFNMINNIAFDV